jgi:general secretion pathway protein E
VLSDEAWNSLAQGWNLARPQTVYRPVGCPECRQTGYRGRTGLYELLTVTPAFSRLITSQTDNHALVRQGMADGMTPLRVAGARKVADGLTTAEEVLKATAALTASG